MQHFMTSPELLNNRLNDVLNRYDPELAREFRNKNIQISIQRRLRWQDRYLLVLCAVLLGLVLLASTSAQAEEAPPKSTGSEETWGMQFIQNEQRFDAVALNTNIEIEVIGSQARVEVSQVFHNQSDSWVEASYRFPLPDNAAVDQLKIEVNGRLLIGEIQERQAAEKVYQQAKQNGQTTSLVRQDKANQFHTRLANIGPNEMVTVKIGFLQPVRLLDGQFRLRLPMTFTAQPESAQITQTPIPATDHSTSSNNSASAVERTYDLNSGNLMLTVNLLTEFELAELNSSYHAINVHETLHGYYIILEDSANDEQHYQADRDFELVWRLQAQDQPTASILTWEDDEGFYAQLQLAPPQTDFIDERPRELIFIIDTSGSMAGEPMRQAIEALLSGLDHLRPEDRFNIIQFNSEANSLLDAPKAAGSEALKNARSAVRNLTGDGGTNILPALKMALKNPSTDEHLRQIIFITDGAVGNEAEIFQYLHEELFDSRLFTVAIGAAPNNWFMRKAAETGRGFYTHIGKLSEITERMNLLWQRISQPVLEDVCIDWGPIDNRQLAEMYPAVIPDLYAGDNLFVTAKLDSPITEVTICGQLNGVDWEYTQPVLKKHANADIASLWARKKIETINDNQLLGLSFSEAREQILEVALRYGLLSRFTALVVVDPEPARSPDENLDNHHIASLKPNPMLINLAQGALGWQLQLLLSLIALLISGGMFWRSGVGKK